MIYGECELMNTGTGNSEKKIWVKRRTLSEFLIKIRSNGGVIDGGEIFCGSTNVTREFNDMADIINIIEEHCDNVGYPQSQRKLRGWDN